MKREHYEQRLFRILEEAGYTKEQVLYLSISDLLEVKKITIPNIRTILFLQKQYRGHMLPQTLYCQKKGVHIYG